MNSDQACTFVLDSVKIINCDDKLPSDRPNYIITCEISPAAEVNIKLTVNDFTGESISESFTLRRQDGSVEAIEFLEKFVDNAKSCADEYKYPVKTVFCELVDAIRQNINNIVIAQKIIFEIFVRYHQ
jgi:hypothetical protein